jgi:hypothetical protein
MTEDEEEILFQAKNDFYEKFSIMINKMLLEIPEHLRVYAEERFQEAASVYGRDETL